MYADHASTSLPTLFPVQVNRSYANPGAPHRAGREARAALEAARVRIAAALRFQPPVDADLAQHLVLTSGGTESNNLVVQQPTWGFVVTLPTEHHATLHAAQHMAATGRCELVLLAPGNSGRVDPAELQAVLNDQRRCSPDRPGLVTVAHVNNEIGTVQDIAVLAAVVAATNAHRRPEHRVWLHADAVQSPGHVPLDVGRMGVDFLSLSAHKFFGPPAVFGCCQCSPASIYWGRERGRVLSAVCQCNAAYDVCHALLAAV